MRIKVLGFVDEIIEVDEALYTAAEAAGALGDFMNPIIETMNIEVTFGREEEFNASV